MWSKIYKYFLILAIGIGGVSCSDDLPGIESDPVPDSPGTVTIRFSNTRGSRSAASDNAETLIKDLVVALYPSGADESEKPVVAKRFTGLTDHNSKTVAIHLTEDMVDKLFNGGINGAQCRLFALANIEDNMAEGATLPEEPTIAEMKDLAVATSFKTTPIPASFIMAGEGTVVYTAGVNTADPGSASGSADLYRAAAKIMLNLNLPESINVGSEESPEIWLPEQNGIQAIISNGVDESVAYPVNPVEDGVQIPWQPVSDDDYYDGEVSEGRSVRSITNNGSAAEYPYVMGVPFYTYPNAWEEKPDENHKTTLTLMVPWRKDGEESWHTYYYQVPVTPTDLPQIVRNYSYNINLNVGMLGSLVPEDPMELENLTYQVVNWSDQSIDVNIQDYRYLVVNPNSVSVQNEGEVMIPFYSSHPVDINDITMTFQRFNFYSDGNGEVVNIEVPQAKLDASETTTDGTTYKMVSYEIVTDPVTNQMSLKINHPLEIWTPVNNAGVEVSLTDRNGTGQNTLTNVTNSIARFVRPTNPEEPFSSYIFKVSIRHKDNPSFSEEITLTQYPGMYIEADRNEGGSYYTSNTGTSDYGFVFVNPTYNQGWQNNYWTNSTTLGGVHGLTGNNVNPNMYVINISQLSVGSDYIIGDPRSKFINNSLDIDGNLVPTADQTTQAGNWCNEADALYNNSNKRRLQYYYPTNEVPATDKAAYMVAPKIRIASSWGVTNQISRVNARRRAATYQERGCPAGRWRLPTLGEFTYITQLSAAGKIPTLFSLNNNYLTAQGVYRVDRNGNVTAQNNATTTAIRAVYDEWYWENSQYQLTSGANGGYTYTLGDVPRGAQ
ncbi:MAG: hypothetical protein HDS36_02790 [Bacteroides sp.]|nr:hypothetical protein [Bacteroides sp.]